MTTPVPSVCGKCRMLGAIGPCDEHGPDQNEQAWEDLRADGGLPESHAVVVHLCAYAHCKGHERPDESCVP